MCVCVCVQDKVRCILEHSQLFECDKDLLERLWSGCSEDMFLLTPTNKQLGLGQEVRQQVSSSAIDTL